MILNLVWPSRGLLQRSGAVSGAVAAGPACCTTDCCAVGPAAVLLGFSPVSRSASVMSVCDIFMRLLRKLSCTSMGEAPSAESR